MEGDFKVADISLADFGRKVRFGEKGDLRPLFHRVYALGRSCALALTPHLSLPLLQELDLAEVEMPGLMSCRTEYAGALKGARIAGAWAWAAVSRRARLREVRARHCSLARAPPPPSRSRRQARCT